ncbi:hypothetical protein VP01_6752g1 [Puccinia sorghi]|uniref:Uncharacterized protein n=1 Tax=Puccinia sorghi TaxID=27349 RepID=A0A0L6UFI9_9BASI|nr:hypothetical protein VP01_6752g1 [Puccinia sorghi]
MSVHSESSDFKYTCKDAQITCDYEWLHQVEKSFKATVALWEPVNDTSLADRNYTSISSDHQLYKRWLDATNWFSAKCMQMHANEEAQSKGIPLHEVPQIRDIWLARREELGLCPPSKPWNDSPSPPSSPTKLSGSKGKEVD